MENTATEALEELGGPMRRLSGVLFSVGLVVSSCAGLLHFFVPYTFAWYSYIPDAPPEIYVSIDYVNFFFSLLLSGLSISLLFFKRRLFAGSSDALVFSVFLTFAWFCRVVVTLVVPWPTPLQVWLIVGFVTVFATMLVPSGYLLTQAASRRAERRAAVAYRPRVAGSSDRVTGNGG